MAIYKVATNQGTYWWGSNRPDWQTTFNARFPGVAIQGAQQVDVSAAPANLRSVLAPYNTGAPAPAPAPAAPPPGPPPKTADQTQEAVERAIAEYKSRATEFDTRNPFAFDEVLARKSAEEVNDPFYKQKLSDFLQGVERQRTRSIEDEQNLLSEIKADIQSYTGRAKLELDRAINASREGFADAGMFFSGRRIGAEGTLETENQMNLSDYLRGQAQRERATTLGGTRTREDLLTQQTIGQRDIGRERQFEVEQDVKEASRRAALQREFERSQFLGPSPGQTFVDYDRTQQELLRGLA